MKAVKFMVWRSTIPCASQTLVFIMKGCQLLWKEKTRSLILLQVDILNISMENMGKCGSLKKKLSELNL